MRLQGRNLIVYLVFIFFFIAVQILASKRSKHRLRLTELGLKRNTVTSPRRNFERKYGNIAKLERRFETIRDLGSIVRCRLRSDETTLVTGNSLICAGKRYMITPEAAKDVEERPATKQTIFSPDGSPQGILSTLKSGLYGKPIVSFLDESAKFQHRSNLIEPHDKYPDYGIYDKGMRSSDFAQFASQKPASVTAYKSSSMYDAEDGQIGNFGGMELGDISHALSSDDTQAQNLDSFYRNERLQNDAFKMIKKHSATNNPFAQYWKSLNSGFYETTRGQLADSDPVANSRHKIPVKVQVKGMIAKRRRTEAATKKSNIQQQQQTASRERKMIPRPSGYVKKASSTMKASDLDHKRYLIFGQQQQQHFPVGMFAGIPIGPWQFNNRGMMPVPRLFSRYPMMPQVNMPSSFERAGPQQGFTRSINSADEWGVRAAPRYFDPTTTGSPIRVPLNPLYAQMRANEYTGEPGLPTRGKFQYGVQPGNGPPFLGFAPVPIMQPIPMGDMRDRQLGIPEDGAMGGGFETEQEGEGYSRGVVPFNNRRNDETEQNQENAVPGLIHGTAHEIPGSRGPVGLPMDGAMANNVPMFGLNQEEGFEREISDESGSSAARSVGPLEDASEDFQKITGPENYVPAPFYRPPAYNPHESEDFFPDGTNEKFRQRQNMPFQRNGYRDPQAPYNEVVRDPEGQAAEIYEDEKQQEEEKEVQEQERKRGTLKSATRIDVNGNKIEEDSDGKFVLTKEHVGFGPITVEAKTAKSAMKDPSDDDK